MSRSRIILDPSIRVHLPSLSQIYKLLTAFITSSLLSFSIKLSCQGVSRTINQKQKDTKIQLIITLLTLLKSPHWVKYCNSQVLLSKYNNKIIHLLKHQWSLSRILDSCDSRVLSITLARMVTPSWGTWRASFRSIPPQPHRLDSSGHQGRSKMRQSWRSGS